jgi:hypothetical protein
VKLLHCLACQDVVKLFEEERACRCGKAKGRYLNARKVEFSGRARVLGMNSIDFLNTVPGKTYEWFLVPEGEWAVQRK